MDRFTVGGGAANGTRFKLLAIALITAITVTVVLFDSSDSSADTRNYVIYYSIADERLEADQYSIDCEGIYVTDDYVFFRSITAMDTVRIGTLPATENIVSRFVDSDLRDDGYVVNPDGGDVSGWFTEPTFENRVGSDDTLSSLDGDGDGVIRLYMKAARLYDVHYEVRNFKPNGEVDSNNPHWYDGYYLEKTDPDYDQNRFEDVEYVVSLIEGQVVPDALPDASVIFNPDSGTLIYLALQYWAKNDGSYSMDRYSVDGTQVTWFERTNMPNYPSVRTSDCTPAYPGLTVSDELDPDGDGTIVLYGTTKRSSGESPTFFVSVTYAQEDLAGRNYGETDYEGMTETLTLKLDASVSGSYAQQTGSYRLTLPSYPGFEYFSNDLYQTSVKYNATASVSVSNGVATISGCRINSSAETYSIGILFVYHRQSVSIAYSGEGGPQMLTGYYGRDLLIPSNFTEKTLFRWELGNLSGDVWTSGQDYYYTVSYEDLSQTQASITALWQEDQQVTVYTVNYISRVNGVVLAPGVVEGSGYMTLPMITYPGYAHLGWALIDPDAGIDYDTTTLVIYPGKTSFTPSAVSDEHKHVDPDHDNMISIDLYAIWCTSYTISFDAGGGSGSMDDVGPVMVNEYVTLPSCAFTKTNCHFVGWATSNGGDAIYMDGASVRGLTAEAQGLVVLYAVWAEDTYFIVFDGNGATSGSMSAQFVDTGSYVTLADNVYVRTGFTFSGWATSAEGAVVYSDGQRFRPGSSMSLYAVWDPIEYYVEFHANGGSGSMEGMTVLYGETVNLPLNSFTMEGGSFLGWTDVNGRSYADAYPIRNLTSVDKETIVLYAVWAQPYYIEYNANGGTGSMEASAAVIGVSYVLPDNGFVNVGHSFLYWNTASDGSGTTYRPGSTMLNAAESGETVTLYAIWHVYVYYVEFDANGGSGTMGRVTANGGVAFDLPDNTFTYEGREFLGWSTDGSATVPMYEGGMTVIDIGTGEDGETVTLYAVWSGKAVTFTLSGLRDEDGTSVGNVTSNTAFGVDLRVGDSLQLTLRGTGTDASSEYTNGWGSTYYLVYFTYDGTQYPYGSVVTITDDMDGKTFAATYTQYRAVITYHINVDDMTYTEESVIPLTRSWGRYSGSASLSDNPFTALTDSKYSFLSEQGYVFCFWSDSADAISGVQAPGTEKVVSNASTIPSFDYYAVWVKLETSEFGYTGSAIEPDKLDYVSGAYTEHITSISAPVYQNNVNAGSAMMTCTLSTYIDTSVTLGFTIVPAEVTVTVNGASKYFGESDPAFTGEAVCGTSAPTDVLCIVYSRSNTDAEDAGSYPGVLTASYQSNPNYSVTVVPADFTILPAEVTIAVKDASKNFGESDPAFTGTVTCPTAPTAVLAVTYYRTNAGTEAAGTYEGVLSASYTANPNYSVTVILGTFTIVAVVQETVYYVIVEGGGGSSTYTDSQTVASGTPFDDKTAVPRSGYSFYEWLRVTYDGGTIVSSLHMTYSRTLESDMISQGTYFALFVPGDSLTFNANADDAVGSMGTQSFTDRSGTLDANAFTRPGYVFTGWSRTADGDVEYYDQSPMALVIGLGTGPTELFAVWKPHTYSSQLHWTVDGYIFSAGNSFLKVDSGSSYAIINGGNTATISAQWLEILADEDLGLFVDMTYGDILFDRGCIATFASAGEDMTFSVKPVNSSGYETFDIRNGEEVVAMYNITASYYDSGVKEYIHSLGGTATVTVRNMSGGNSVVYVGNDGSQPTGVTSTADTITFTTDHFSLYEITDVSESEGRETISLVVTMGIIAAVLTAAVCLLNFGRRGS